MTQPAFPARPYQAPLLRATPPQGLPGLPQPGPPQSRPAPTYPPPTGPPPGYPRPAYEQQQPEQLGFEPFRPYQPQVPPSAGQPPTGPPGGPPRQPPRRHDGRRSGSSLALWIILLVVIVGGGVAGALIAHPFSHQAVRETASTGDKPAAPGGSSAAVAGSASPGGASSAGPASGSGTASPSAPAVTEQQAATSVATMLAQSVSDRAAISSAAADVGNCGPNLNADPKVFDDAASSRKSLLASLNAMPGRAALPAALVSDLTQAWQASVAADQAYAKWASDEVTQGCVVNDTSDPGYLATVTPDQNATKYKAAFVGEWNPVAARYGLTQYQQDKL